MKTAILGYSGSGKSTLASAIAAHDQCPLLHLDAVHFLPDWEARDDEIARAMVRAFMENDGWVIDGNYQKLLHAERLAQADEIVLMLFPRMVCLWRVWRRYRKYRGRFRESVAAGCNEKLDWAFFRWVMRDGRTKRIRACYGEILRQYPQKAVALRTPAQVKAYRKRRGLEAERR